MTAKKQTKKAAKIKKSEAVNFLQEKYTNFSELLKAVNAEVGKKTTAGKYLTQIGITEKVRESQLLHTGEGKKMRTYKLAPMSARNCKQCAHKGIGAWGRNVYRFNDRYYVLVTIQLTFADVLQSLADAEKCKTANIVEYNSAFGNVLAAPRTGKKFEFVTLFQNAELREREQKVVQLNAEILRLQAALEEAKRK